MEYTMNTLHILDFLQQYHAVISSIAAILSVCTAITAIIISLKIAHKQNRIALLEKRIKVLDELENYCSALYETDYKNLKHKKYSKEEILCIFDHHTYLIIQRIMDNGKEIDRLLRGYPFALKHDTWEKMNPDEILSTVCDIAQDNYDMFFKEKAKLYKKYIKI